MSLVGCLVGRNLGSSYLVFVFLECLTLIIPTYGKYENVKIIFDIYRNNIFHTKKSRKKKDAKN